MPKTYPCDGPEGCCPYMTSEEQATGMYFCYNHCGLGADEDDSGVYIGDEDLETLADQVYDIEHQACTEHQWIATGCDGENGIEILECAICGRLEVIHMV